MLLQCLKARKFLGLLPTFCTNVSDRALTAAGTLTSEITGLRDEFLLSLKSRGNNSSLVGCFFPRSSSNTIWQICRTSLQALGLLDVNYSLGFMHAVLRNLWLLLHMVYGFLSPLNGLGGAVVTLVLNYIENIFTFLSKDC